MILLKYPWEKDYIAAILETDDGKLANLIATAQSTMLARVDELNRTRGGTIEEREDLALALGGLHKMRVERLGGS
jgi:hypothetical protein